MPLGTQTGFAEGSEPVGYAESAALHVCLGVCHQLTVSLLLVLRVRVQCELVNGSSC